MFTFMDFFLFFFLLQFFFSVNNSLLSVMFDEFMSIVKGVFSFDKNLPQSYFFVSFLFLFMLFTCFFGYFSFSFSFFSVFEFTFFFALIAWLTTFLNFISNTSFLVHLSKSGDGFFKTFFFMLVEVVSEFSRPFALTIRLFINVLLGHVLSSMVYTLVEFTGYSSFILLHVFLILFEFFVFFIQSYIFSYLIYMYMGE